MLFRSVLPDINWSFHRFHQLSRCSSVEEYKTLVRKMIVGEIEPVVIDKTAIDFWCPSHSIEVLSDESTVWPSLEEIIFEFFPQLKGKIYCPSGIYLNPSEEKEIRLILSNMVKNGY